MTHRLPPPPERRARRGYTPVDRPRWLRRIELAVFAIYAAWCLVALIEIIGRHVSGSSPFPGILANHNGNIAVSGFIVPSGFVARFVRERQWLPRRLARYLATAIVVLTGAAWTGFFVIMELVDAYGPNYRDPGDIPASIFGAMLGTYAAWLLAHAQEPAAASHRRVKVNDP